MPQSGRGSMQGLSSTESCLLLKVVFHASSSSTEGRLQIPNPIFFSKLQFFFKQIFYPKFFFRPKIIFKTFSDPKFIWTPKFLGLQFLWTQKFLNRNFFVDPNFFGTIFSLVDPNFVSGPIFVWGFEASTGYEE